MIVISILAWLLMGIFGVFYNISYIDEAKYLIKGWLMATGQVGYYSTADFFYQHLPGGLLWFGLGQKLFGPSLLVGRIQSLILSWVIFWLTYILAKTIAGKAAGKLSLLMLTLAPGAQLYYASAIPHALAVVVLLAALITLIQKRYLLATIGFSLAFITRENFLFTLIIYFGYLAWRLKFSRSWFNNLAVCLLTLAIFFIPGWPGILKVLYNFPGVSAWLPISEAQKNILGLNWQITNYNLNLYIRAVLEFGVIYFSFLIGLLVSLQKIKPALLILIIIAGFNFLAHTWSAFYLTPRAIVSYFAYVMPIFAVIAGVGLTRISKTWLKLYPLLLIVAIYTNRYSSVAGHLGQPTHLRQISQSVPKIEAITDGKKNIVWLAEPMALYLSGRISYYPLINHTNFFKPSNDTATVRSLGFWNQTMMALWLEQADLVVIDSNRLSLLEQNPLTVSVAKMITKKLQIQFNQFSMEGQIWPGNLNFYLSK